MLDNDKAWLLLVWICASVAVIVVSLMDFWGSRGKTHPLLDRVVMLFALSGLALVFVFATWQNGQYYAPLPQWNGFDFTSVILGSAVATVALTWILRQRSDLKILVGLSIIVVAFLAILPILQLSFDWNAQFTFDELLAPSNGRFAGFNYISKYETLLGLPRAASAG